MGSGGCSGAALGLKWTVAYAFWAFWGCFGGDYVFSEGPPQTEGRRNADPLIKIAPVVSSSALAVCIFCPVMRAARARAFDEPVLDFSEKHRL